MKGNACLAILVLACGCIGQTAVEEEVTPLSDFFVIDQGTQPEIDAEQWRLEVSGLVDTELNLGYDDILEFPSETRVARLKCVMAGLEGVGKWKGILLKDVLEKAHVREGAISVIVTGADGYTATLTLEEAFRDTAMLATEMNGVPLPKEHGYPLRLVLPGALGYKWVKWIVKIEVVGGRNTNMMWFFEPNL